MIKRAIIDDNVSIGRNVKITNKDNVDEADSTKQGWVIQNGIVVVLKGAVIPDGTEIWCICNFEHVTYTDACLNQRGVLED